MANSTGEPFLHLSLASCFVSWFQVSPTNSSEPEPTPVFNGTSQTNATSKPDPPCPPNPTPQPSQQSQSQPVKTTSQSQETPKRTSLGIPQAFNASAGQAHKGPVVHTGAGFPNSPQPMRPKAHTVGECETQKQWINKRRSNSSKALPIGVSTFMKQKWCCCIFPLHEVRVTAALSVTILNHHGAL